MLALNPECMSFHEIISVEEDWRGVLRRELDCNVCVADCGTYQYFPGAVIHGSRKVFIQRPVEECCAAWNRATKSKNQPEDFSSLERLAQNWIEEERPLVVNFATLWNVSALTDIWHHCFDNTPCPERKLNALLRMNIQRHNPKEAFDPRGLSGRVRELLTK